MLNPSAAARAQGILWTRPHLAELCDAIRHAVEGVAGDGSGKAPPLTQARAHGHQIAHTLDTLTVDGAARLAHALAAALDAIDEDVGEHEATTILEAVAILPNYLERLETGAPDTPQVLAERIAELHAIAGHEPAGDDDALAVLDPASAPVDEAPDPNTLRREWQRALRDWLMDPAQSGGLVAVTEQLIDTPIPSMRRVGTAAGATFAALAEEKLTPTPEINKQLAGIDALLRLWAVEGPGPQLDAAADAASGALLGHLRSAEPGLDAVDRLRSEGAAEKPAVKDEDEDEEELERARSVLSGRNRELFTAVAEAARGELNEAKDALNTTLIGAGDEAPDLADQAALLNSVAESLSMLGLNRLADRVRAQAGRLDELTGDPDSPALLDVARELLLVDSELEEAVLYLGEAPSSELLEGDGAHLPKSEHRRVMRQVLHECLDDLSQAKHLLDQLHRGQSDGNSADQARHTLERLAGVLRMAGLGEAAELVEASSRSVQEQLIDQPPEQADRDRLAALAEALVVTEFYLDSLTRLDDRGPEYLASARTHLAELGYIEGAAADERDGQAATAEAEEHEAAADETADAEAVEADADAADEIEADGEDAEPTDEDAEGIEFEPTGFAPDAEGDERETDDELGTGGLEFETGSAGEESGEAAESADVDAESETDAEAAEQDAEGIEFESTPFEAQEDAQEAEASLETPGIDFDDFDGDFSSLDETASADSDEALDAGGREGVGVEAPADEVFGEPDAAEDEAADEASDDDIAEEGATDEDDADERSLAAEGEPSAEAADEDEGEPALEESGDDTAADESAGAVTEEQEPEAFEPASALAGDDFDLTEIFLEEFDEELAALQERLPRWRDNLDDRELLADIRRSFHTLKGSGRMAGAEEIGEFSWAFEQILNQTQDNQFRPEEVIDLVEEAVQALPSLRNRLVGEPADLDEAAVEALVERAGRVGAEQTLPELEGLDDQLVQLMIKEISDHLESVDAWINGSRNQGWALPVDRDLIRSVHTIKGTLRLAPVGDEAESMQIIEEYLQELADTEATPSDDAVVLIEDMRTMLAKRLERLNQEAVSTRHFETAHLAEQARSLISSLHRRRDADDAAWSDEYKTFEAAEEQAAQDETTDETIDEPVEAPADGTTEPADDDEAIELETDEDESVEDLETAPADASADDEIADTEEDEADDAAIEFEDESETQEPVAEDEQADEREALDETSDDEPESEDAVEAIEFEDDDGEDDAEAEADEDDVEAEVEVEVEADVDEDDAESEEDARARAIEIASKVEATFEEWPESQIGEVDRPAEPEAEQESDEAAAARTGRDTIAVDYASLDDELVDLFAEEGQELLEHADGLLQQWRENPSDRALVTALQRDVHTIKGSARMAGLNPIGEVAHVLEDLLESIAGGQQEATAQRIDTLETGCDHLHGMVDAVTRREALPARPSGEAIDSDDEASEALETVTRQVEADDSASADARTGRASTIRIASERVEELLNFAGEISIFRSRIEQEIGGFRGNIGEIEQTVARLREQLRNLEAETEAQILSRYEREHGPDEEEFDPLELDRYSTIQQLSRALAESVSDLNSLTELMDDSGRQTETLLMQQARVNTELQEGLMQARMVSFNTLAPRLRRVVRNAARDAGRKAELDIVAEGEGELDRNVLDRMTAPIEHILRNAIAHGIESPSERRDAGKSETGRIRIEIDREATELLIRISDDGGGLNLDRIRERALEQGLIDADQADDTDALSQIIFQTGFSTAEAVSELSGRGVGMDVVASEIRQVGGRINVQTETGKGTRFTLRIPLSLAVMQAIFVEAGERLFSIPLQAVRGVAKIRPAEWQDALDGDGLFHYGGQDYPLLELEPQLGFDPEEPEEGASMSLLMITTGDQRAAIRVTDIQGHREIVLKPVGPQISSIPGILGGTIMGDGQVVVILDMAPLIERAIREQRLPGMVQRSDSTAAEVEEVKRTPLVMVVDDSITMRRVTSRILEHHGLEVLTARDGVEAVDLLFERVPDLMLLDIEMPRMDGFELAAHVRDDARLSDVPIMMITSRSGDKHRDRAKKLGVDRYLIKPYQEANMVRNVFEMLEMPVPGDDR
ncbi:Hpt domain-containing protein [Halomonas denitrificans]|nr:Hpt domain-containing protein [Halomonas denitrificans]